LFPSLIPALLLTVAGIQAVDGASGRWRSAFRLLLAGGLVVGLGVNLPKSAGAVAGRAGGATLRPELEARGAGIEEALVLVKVGWGSRLISRLWSWGISASETERSFQTVDGCRLQRALDEADSLAAAGRDSADVRSALESRLRNWREMRLPVMRDVLPDPTVRVDTTRALEQRCRLEVDTDSRGFTVYGVLIWQNDPWLQDGIVYARDFGLERNRRLLARYPGRDLLGYAPLTAERGARPTLRRSQRPTPDEVSPGGDDGGAGE
jgi:hypothetical protein